MIKEFDLVKVNDKIGKVFYICNDSCLVYIFDSRLSNWWNMNELTKIEE